MSVSPALSFSSATFADENMEIQAEETSGVEAQEMLDLDENDDTKIEIAPLDIQMSDNERQQENSSSVDFIEHVDKLNDLPCDDQRLREQVEAFIYEKISEKSRFRLLKSVNVCF